MARMTPEARSETLIEALPYIQEYRGHTFVIKYGGSAMEDEQIVDKFLRDVVFFGGRWNQPSSCAWRGEGDHCENESRRPDRPFH